MTIPVGKEVTSEAGIADSHVYFDTKEEAVAYCERKGIPYQVIEPKESAHRQVAYADNFAFRRGEPWTH